MSSDNRGTSPGQPPSIYIVHPGYQQNVNYGFHQEPPPKYEHVINGMPTEQCQTVPQSASVIFVAPRRVYRSGERLIQYSCLAFFLIIISVPFIVLRK